MNGVLADRWLMWCRSRAQSLSVSSKTVSITGAQLSKYCWRDEDPAEGSVLLWLINGVQLLNVGSAVNLWWSREKCVLSYNLVNLWLPLRETAYCVGSSLDLWYSSLLSLHSQDVVCNLWCLPYYQLPTSTRGTTFSLINVRINRRRMTWIEVTGWGRTCICPWCRLWARKREKWFGR